MVLLSPVWLTHCLFIGCLREGSSETWGCWMKLRLMLQLELQREHLDVYGLPWAVVSQLDDQDSVWAGMVCRGDGIDSAMGRDRVLAVYNCCVVV